MMTRVRAAILLAPVVVLASACSSPPSEFQDRAKLRECPTEELGQEGDSLSDTAIACLDRGSKERPGAELRVVKHTSEGDDVNYYYRVQFGDPGFIVYVDSTADTYGEGGWSKVVCSGGVDYNMLDECSTADLAR